MTLAEIEKLSEQRPIIFYDGLCNVCHYLVQFILKYDRKGVFLFSPLQSDAGQSVLKNLSLKLEPETVILLDEGKYYTHSDAVIQIFNLLRGIFRILKVFRVIPKSWRDALYIRFSKSRYRIFGKKDQCILPSDVQKERFLE
ncbi:MAG: DUF393 domain-containing protein [Saprospiraceae bacterium]|nr:DUF393 domain-containing protein [Saprospiraceae bacterium]